MDQKDEHLVELLDQNARNLYSDLSKDLRMSKQTVINRVNNLLQKEGYIQSYFTLVNYFKLGLNNINILLSIDGLESWKLENLIADLSKFRSIKWIAQFFGEYDIGISIFYTDLSEANKVISYIQNAFDDKINKMDVYSIVENQFFSLNRDILKRKKFTIQLTGKTVVQLSKRQKEIVGLVEKNPRISYVRIAQALKVSPNAIKYALKSLEQNGVIVGYKLLLDFNKMGFQWGYCIFDCIHSNEFEKLLGELALDKRVIMVSRSVSNSLIVDFLYRSVFELKDFVDDYKGRYACIYTAKLMNILKLHKLAGYFYIE